MKANKPCILEECKSGPSPTVLMRWTIANRLETDGGANNCTIENPWQATALASKGIAGDMFWQYGDTLPSCNCQTSQDGNTVFYNQGNWDCMVTQHVAAINAS